MAFDAFLKLDGIKGESTDATHKDEIEVLSFSWGVSQTATLGTPAGGRAGKATFQDLHFTSVAHKGSPNLFLSCATGEHLKEAVLTLRKAGGRGVEFLKIKLTDVLISSYLPNGAADGDTPSEEISLNFGKIEFAYTPQNADGAPGTAVSAGYDLIAGKAV
jgi:type VI secretion system secreted protein Hcp